MILYLTSNDHVNLLDFTETPHKRMVGLFMLSQFVVRDMRNFSHCTHLILDRAAISENDSDFIMTIEEFLVMYPARVTVLCEGLQPGAPLFQGLLDIGVGNIVTASTIEEMQKEIREVLSERGMTKYSPKERIRDVGKLQFACENVKIAVIAAQSRIGATTTAIGLTSWLGSVGADVRYIEAGESRHLSGIAASYGMEPCEGGYLLDSIPFLATDTADFSGHFSVYDIGCGYARQKQLITQADVVIVCCGTKPYELNHTVSLLKDLDGTPLFVAMPFVDEGLRDSYYSLLFCDCHKALFLEYQPDFFDDTPNAATYRRIVQNYVTGG